MEAKILVVDDEPEIREVLVRFLSAPGYVVMAAADGPEALALAASVVLMTAYPSPETKAAGLERGACSYLVKPFTKAEVLAAVELGLREAKAVQVGDLLLDPRARRVVCGDEEVCLTHLEFDLLAYLVRNAGRVVGYDELLREVWGYDYTAGGQETIKSCVKRLRRKIEPDPEQPRYLVTVRGVGYRWAIPPTLVLPQPPRG